MSGEHYLGYTSPFLSPLKGVDNVPFVHMCFQLVTRGVNAASYAMCVVGSLDRNVAKLKEMLQEMREMTVDKEDTQSKLLCSVHLSFVNLVYQRINRVQPFFD